MSTIRFSRFDSSWSLGDQEAFAGGLDQALAFAKPLATHLLDPKEFLGVRWKAGDRALEVVATRRGSAIFDNARLLGTVHLRPGPTEWEFVWEPLIGSA